MRKISNYIWRVLFGTNLYKISELNINIDTGQLSRDLEKSLREDPQFQTLISEEVSKSISNIRKQVEQT